MTELDVRTLTGATVVDRSGARIGPVEQVYLDDGTGEPEWVTVRAGDRETFVPLAAARYRGGELVVDATAEQVAGAPRAGRDGHLSAAEEVAVYRYYGLDGHYAATDDATDDAADRGGDDAMTRSEEHLVARAPRVETTRARLRKYVVTETVTVEVPVRREEVRLEHEPAPGSRGGTVTEVTGDPGDDGTEMILHAERTVVTTETVPVERVRLGKETVTGTETVTGEVRREEIELDDPTGTADGPR